jgi:signal transduction histidine kinase
MWAYDRELLSAHPGAPAFPPALAAALREGEARAAQVYRGLEGEGRQVAVRMPWTNTPCDVVLASRPFPPSSRSGSLLLGAIALMALALLAAVLWALAPLVVRLGRLARVARAAATGGYLGGVDEDAPDEIGDVARAFNEAGRAVREHVARLEARETSLRDFVANTTHDVMVPLSVLQGHLSTLRRQAARQESVDASVLDGAVEEVQHLGALLHNLGALAKLEAGDVHLDLHPVDLGALVERVVVRHRSLAAAQGVELGHAAPETPLLVAGDVTLLEQLAGNLVHNAIRYNHEGGHVAVVVGIDPHDAGHFLLRVEDDGPGIPAEELPRATERAFRGRDARTRKPGGAGLGLTIARDVAGRHGLELGLAPREEGGLCVTVRGPLAPAS